LINKINVTYFDNSYSFLKNLKTKLEDGSVKVNPTNSILNKYYLGPNYTDNLDSLYSRYILRRSSFKKNNKSSLKTFDSLANT
jgi:hypothetical protein